VKKVFIAIILVVSIWGFGKITAVIASPGSTTTKLTTVELTINSSGAGGSQFILNGLQTPATPIFACTKTSSLADVAGTGTGVHVAIVDAYGVDSVKVTVTGTVVGKLTVQNDTYVDLSGNPISGRIAVRQLR